MATSRLQEEEKARESTVETLSTRQDNLLGWSLWPLWDFMERQLVVLGLPGTHISCPAFVLLLSLSCLMIYTHAMIIYHINYFANRERRRQPERGMEGEQRVHKNSSMVSSHHLNIFPSNVVVRNYRNICSLCCSFNSWLKENCSLYLPWWVNTPRLREYSWISWEL